MFKILIDAGHGAGRAHNRGGVCYNEGDNNFHYSLVLKSKLEKYKGVQVGLTRTNITQNPSLSARSSAGRGYDLFLSVHSNAGGGGRARGSEIWDSVEKPNKALAEKIVAETAKVFGHPNRGVKYRTGQPGFNWYGVLRFNGAKSAMILENGFHDNALDCAFFKNNHKLIAETQAKTIVRHYGLDGERTETTKQNNVLVGPNSRGEHVKSLQRTLNKLGFNVGVVDGIAGKNTIDGIKAFQKANGLVVDGWFGVNSYKALEKPPVQNAKPSSPVKSTLVKSGDRGNVVKELQSNLNKLGFNAGTADGIAGVRTISAIKKFQRAHKLTVDGIFGAQSYAALEKALKKVNKQTSSQYIEIGNAKIIKTKPENIEIKVLGNTLNSAKEYGINGTFFDTSTAPVSSPNSCVFIAMNEGKAISNNAQFNGWKSPPRATLIYHRNRQMGFRKLTNINLIRESTNWAIGGYMVKPYMDFKNEGMPGSINYKTAHTYIGYDADNNIYLIVKPNHMIQEIVPLLDELKIINAIVLDGGGSSQLNHPLGSIRSTRRINTAVVLKQA